jgi:hypothetical protein
MTHKEKKEFIRRYRLMSYTTLHVEDVAVIEFTCKCKLHRSKAECDHEAAGSHVLGIFDIFAQVSKIKTGRVCGRPRKPRATGYAAIKESLVQDPSTLHWDDYKKLIHEQIVQFYHPPYTALPFIGVVTGTETL